MSATPDSFRMHAYLRGRFHQLERKLRFHGNDSDRLQAWQEEARPTLRRLIGLDTMRACDLHPEVTERVDCGEHVRERLVIQVEPGLHMPVYVLVPKQAQPPYVPVLAPHGHGAGGKAAVAGVRENAEITAAIPKYNYDYGVALVNAGFLVFCPEARGFGERQETKAAEMSVLSESCLWINHMALPLGQTVTGMWVWDLMRLIDYIETRSDCDAGRLASAGLSGGGLQTMWLAALDQRVKAAVNSGYFYGVQEALQDKYWNCSCNYVPHLWEYADHGDLGGLIAPRPFMVQSGDEDAHNGVSGMANVYAQVELARNAYRAAGAEHYLEHDVFHGPHRWDSTHTIPFLRKHLMLN